MHQEGMSWIVLLSVVSSAVVVAHDDLTCSNRSRSPSPIAGIFEVAYDKNADFWSSLPYTTMPRPPRPATDLEAECVVLLRIFIDLYMNKLRLEKCSLDMSDFVNRLPISSRNLSSRPSTANLIEFFAAMLQTNGPVSPSILPPLTGARVVLNVFGSMFRSALYSDDDIQTWRATSFVAAYVQVMALNGITHPIALAVLARDVVLATENVPTEAQVLEAANKLQCFIVILDQKPGLSEAVELLNRLALSKSKQFNHVEEMAPHLYLELLVFGLDRDHAALREFCSGRALRFRNDIGFRMAVILEQLTLLLVASSRIDVVSHLISWVNQQTLHRSGFLPYLALFWDRNHLLLDELSHLKLVPFESKGVMSALNETLYNFKTVPLSLLNNEKLPALKLLDEVKKLISHRLEQGPIEWPTDWP